MRTRIGFALSKLDHLGVSKMPVLILWAIPAIVVVSGGAYWIAHMH